MTKRRRGTAARLNLADLAEGMARPGNDPREWVSYGTVRGGTTDDDPCVEFEEDQPLVRVLLQPSLREVRCRVAMFHAGDGEAEWHPFMPDDEVLVVIPEGHERAGPCIVGRLSNAIDKFPSGSVAGQDPRKNNFAFRRLKAPHVEELNGPVMQRSAKTGGFVSIDDSGVLTLRGGNPDDPTAAKPAPGFQMSADGISMQDASAKFALSFGPTSGAFLLLVDDAVLSIPSSSSSAGIGMLGVPDSFSVGTSGNAPIEHVATAESVINVLVNFVFAMNAAIIAGGSIVPLTGASLGALITGFLQTGVAAAVAAAGAGGGPASSMVAAALAALQGAIASQPQKQSSPLGQLQPGVGCQGFLAG